MSSEQAFLAAFEAHADALFRHCSFRVADRERARDIVADTFARTWDYIVRGNVVEDYKPFLYRTLNHLIIDEYRKKRTESLDALLEEAEVPVGAFPELVVGGMDELEWALDAKQVPALLQEMPEQYRTVVVMRFMDGLLPAEIAQALGETTNVVSVRIHRGVSWLSKRVDQPVPKNKGAGRDTNAKPQVQRKRSKKTK